VPPHHAEHPSGRCHRLPDLRGDRRAQAAGDLPHRPFGHGHRHARRRRRAPEVGPAHADRRRRGRFSRHEDRARTSALGVGGREPVDGAAQGQRVHRPVRLEPEVLPAADHPVRQRAAEEEDDVRLGLSADSPREVAGGGAAGRVQGRGAAGHHQRQRGATAGSVLSEFADRHVLVTGASSGIGLATARLLARQGARVYLIARSEAKLAAATEGITREGGTAAYGVADVADRSALMGVIEKAERAFGPAAGLFANAGTGGRFARPVANAGPGGGFAPLCEYDDELFDTVLRTNLTSIYWAIKRVLPAMLERRSGSIVVTGSLASERGMPHNVAYVASKHAVLGLARAAAAEAAPHNVRVNCVIPGLIETPMLLQLDPSAPAQVIRDRLGGAVPLGHIGTADALAQLGCFLLS